MKTIEEKYAPILEILEDNLFLQEIKKEYRGFITALNPFVFNPKILFIGINPGDGAFNEKNPTYNSISQPNEPNYPKILFSNTTISQIDWLKNGNARGEKIGKVWKSYKWHEQDKKVNNVFVKRMTEFLISYYNVNNETIIAEIENKINSEIFYWNVTPISTKTVKELDCILQKIVSKKINVNGKEINTLKDLKNFFRQRTIDLIEYSNPEIIVCLGNQAFKDLTASNNKTATNDCELHSIKFRKNNAKTYPVYIVPRNGNWESKIKNLGKKLQGQ